MNNNICEYLSSGDFYAALETIKDYVEENGDRNDTLYKIEQLETGMTMSCQWWKDGKDMPEGDNMLATYFIPQLSRIWDDYMLLDWMTANNSYLMAQRNKVRASGRDWSWNEIRKRLEGFVSTIAVMQLQSDTDRNMEEKLAVVYDEQKKYRQQLLSYVLTELRLSDSDLQELEELLQTPTIDNIDQRIIITAMTLNGLVAVDPVKLKLLLSVYQKSHDTAVRQYALVGLMLMLPGLDYPTTKDIVRQVADCVNESAGMREDMAQLQIQLSYCESAEKDSQDFQENILPEIMKASNYRMTEDGVEMAEEDPMDDILGRSDTEKRMEDIETRMHSFFNKRREGVDIFFQGFKVMRRYPFFSELSNWLMPFYREHPDIREAKKRIGGGGDALFNMMLEIPMCDSDKYSFILSLANMIDKMPKELLEKGNTYSFSDRRFALTEDAAVIRRDYVHSLYRFFELFPYKESFVSPFSDDTGVLRNGEIQQASLIAANDAFRDTLFSDNMLDLMRFYLRRKDWNSLYYLICSYGKEREDCFEICYFRAMFSQMHFGEDTEHLFKLCVEKNPDSVQAKKVYARFLFDEERYEEAKSLFAQLMVLQERNRKWMRNYAVCCINIKEYDEALRVLFRLNYEDENDIDVTMLLAKTLFLAGRAADAAKLLDSPQMSDEEDYNLTMGFCKWALKEREAASCLFASLDYDLDEEPDYGIFADEFRERIEDYWDEMKAGYGLTQEELSIMIHSVWEKLEE